MKPLAPRAAYLFAALLALALLPTCDAAERSPHWEKVRAEHLKAEPSCAWCGGAKDLQVHHVKPFHEHPELELDQANLITLCEAPGLNCHLIHGHHGDWKKENPEVREQCELHRAMVRIREAAAARIVKRKCEAKAAALQKRLIERIDQRVADSGRTWDACAVDVATDWLADRRGALEAGNQDRWDEAAAFLLLVYDRGVTPAPDVRRELVAQVEDILRRLAAE